MPADSPPSRPPPTDPDATVAPPIDPAGDTITRSPGGGAAASPPGTAVPGFAIEGELGRGGMGVVYKARQLPLNRPVALKMVLSGAHADPKDRARFLAEAEAVAAVHHPHVVQVFEFGEHDGNPYFAMEFLDGGSLAGLLQSRGKLPPAEAAALVEKCARGVQAAHDLGIVHRDLKPANILLQKPEVRGQRSEVRSQKPESNPDLCPLISDLCPKVTDFGLAKRGGQADLTRTGAVMGTPAYMAPEQARGEGKFVGPGADVYALGVILFECLAGRPPFRADDAVSLLMQVATAEAPSVRRFAPAVPRDLDLICRKCLAKGPHERYPTAGLLADDLGRFLRGEPVTARPVGPVERTVKWVRRNPVVAAAAAVVLIAVLGGSGVALWQAVEARRAEREARRAEKLAQDRLDQQEKANELMLSVFRGLRPNDDHDTTTLEKTVADQLDQVTPQLNESVVEDPLTLARLREALGYGQLRLRRLDQAHDLFAQAVRVREAELGPDHPDTVNARDGLARVLVAQTKHAGAADLFAATLPARETALGPGHADVLASRRGLADALHGLGRKEEAARLLAENLHWYESTLGPDHKRTLAARDDLATRYQALKDYAAATRLLEANRAHYQSRNPSPGLTLGLDIDRMRTESALATLYLKQGRHADAEHILAPLVEMFDKLTGPESPSSLGMREKLAEAYLGRGRDAEAIPLLESNIRVSERLFGARPSSDLLGTFAQLGLCPARLQLARAYGRAGQADKARAQLATAEQVFRAVLTHAKGLPEDEMMKVAARMGLAEVLVAQKKYAEAEPLLLAAHQQLAGQPDADPDDVRQVVGWLVEVYGSTGKADEKAKWEAKLKALPAAKGGR